MDSDALVEMVDWALRPGGNYADSIAQLIAEQRRFRVKFVREQPREKRVLWFKSVVERSRSPVVPHLMAHVLKDFHFEFKKPLMTAFLDGCGIAHQDCEVVEQGSSLDPAKAAECVNRLIVREDSPGLLTYLATAGWWMEDWRPVLWRIVDEYFDESRKPASAPAPAETPPETETVAGGRSFSVLDNLMIKTVVAAMSQVEGAPTVDQISDAVEELVSLNSDRHQSYFHRGFLNTLVNRPVDHQFHERNSSRVGWLIAGEVMALARRRSWPDLIKFCEENRGQLKQMMADGHEAAPMILPQIFEAFWSQERHEDALAFLDVRIVAQSDNEFHERLLRVGEMLLLERHTAEARRVLDVLYHAPRPEHTADDSFGIRVSRRRAQCSRAEGRFDDAATEFRFLLDRAGADFRAEILSDLALCNGKFRWLSEVLIPVDEEDVASMARNIEAGEPSWNEAIGLPTGRTTNAAYALGVLHLLRKRDEPAKKLLALAYSGAIERSDTYRFGGLLDLIREHYGMSILLSWDQAEFASAEELLRHSPSGGGPLPRWRTGQMLEAAVLLSHPDARFRIVQILVDRNPELVDACLKEDPEGLGDQLSEWLEGRIGDRADDRTRTPQERWDDSVWLLTSHLRKQDTDAARQDLDRMEVLAGEDSRLRSLLLEFLSEQDNYLPAWTEEDAGYVRARLFEEDGDFTQALVVLRPIFFDIAANEDPEDALGIFGHVESFGLDPADYSDLARRASGLAAFVATEDVAGSPEAANLSVLFVGGDERQRGYDRGIMEELASTHPGVVVEFIHPGWSGHWNGHLEDVKRKLSSIDVLVVSKYNRTEFGRSVRAAASEHDVPWVACTGRGRKSILLSIHNGIRLAATPSPSSAA
jgi:hypothetical protein